MELPFRGGGNLFHRLEDFLPLIKEFSERTGQNIWCYTGYTYENFWKILYCLI